MTGIFTIRKIKGKDQGFELEDNSVVKELRVEAMDFAMGTQSQAMNALYASLSKASTNDKYEIKVELEE